MTETFAAACQLCRDGRRSAANQRQNVRW